MNETLKKILKPFVKGIYSVIMWMRRLFARNSHNTSMNANAIAERKAVVVSSEKRGNQRGSRNAARVEGASLKGTRQKADEKPFWKDWRVLAAVGGVIAAALVLFFIISGSVAGNSEQGETSASADTDTTGENSATVLSDALESDVQGVSTVSEQEAESTSVPTTTPIPTAVATTEPDEQALSPGCHDVRIIEIQERLMELGYMEYDEPTDYYGEITEYSLQLFQRKHDLQVDGILGDATLNKLFADDAHPYTVKIGDSGTDVVLLQERLQELDFLAAGSTGYFGTDTETAVKSFQSRNGLSADGNVGEITREVLFSEDAKAKQTSSSSGSSSGSSGSSSGNTGPIAVGDADSASADALIEFAKTQLGKPYVRGGKGSNSFDCSGFVYYCLNSVGYSIGYMTSGGWGSCSLPRVESMSDMQKGDIICFRGHVGIYMGGDQMIDASSSNGKIVIRSNISSSSYWTSRFICARRVF